MFRQESAVEYFKQLVDDAIVVHLLAGFVRRPTLDDSPLAVRLVEALRGCGPQQREILREVGDVALFMSGFFAESLRRGVVDVDYYVSIGGSAYGALSRFETDAFSPGFAELAGKFVGFVDVLSEVSERSSCASNLDLLRLYERWLKTGSPRRERLLLERGVVPNIAARNTRVQ